MSTEKPLDDKALEQFLKDIHIEFGPGGFQVETAEKLAALARRAPVESVPAPVGLDLEAAEKSVMVLLGFASHDPLAEAMGPELCAHVDRIKAVISAYRASLSPRPATGASTSGRRETGPEIAKRLGIKVKDQQDQIDIESGKRIGEDPATGAREDDSDFPPIGEAQHLCRKCSRPTDLHRAGDFLIWQCHHCKLLWHSPAPATGADQGGAK